MNDSRSAPDPAGQKNVPARVEDEIRDILNRYWDPIGVMDDREWPRDEYDSYIAEIHRFVQRREPADFIARHLCFIERHFMGFGAVPETERLSVAERLLAIDLRL